MTNPVLTDELIAGLEAAANAATPGRWCTDGDLWVMARDSDQLNNGFVIAICDGPDGRKNAEYMAKASASVILALLAERAELKQQLAAASVDADRYRYVRSRSSLDGINLQIDANDSNGKQSTIIARWNLADELIDAARNPSSD